MLKHRNKEVYVDVDYYGVVGISIKQVEVVVLVVLDHIGIIIMLLEILINDIRIDFSNKEQVRVRVMIGNEKVVEQVIEIYMDC